jgi:hypothetical protein
MKYIYTGPSGMLPNLGELATGQEVGQDLADRLHAAGYDVATITDATTPVQPDTGGETK